MLLTERPKIRTSHTITYMTQKEIESVFKRINNEAKIAIRTLTWIEEVEDKEIEGEPEENISSKDIDKEKDSDV